MSIFIKSRFTHTDEPYWFSGEDFLCLGILDEFLKQYGKIVHRTYGEEQASRPHIHIHYELDISKSTKKIPKVIHQTFIYYIKSKKGFKGNPPSKSSSITTNDKEDEPGRILRYPLKEDHKHFHLCLGYNKAELHALHARANEEYRIALKNKQTHQAKKDKDEKTWNALCEFLDKNLEDWQYNEDGLTLHQKVRETTIVIYRYYVLHKGCMVSRNLRDKAIRYLLIKGHHSALDELYYYYHPN